MVLFRLLESRLQVDSSTIPRILTLLDRSSGCRTSRGAKVGVPTLLFKREDYKTLVDVVCKYDVPDVQPKGSDREVQKQF